MNRETSFDIFKGLMIICVVIGHTNITTPYVNVFWFHMPAFFFISGYLTKNWCLNRETWQKKIKKMVIPYFVYSVLLYCIFHPEPILKNVARTLYAGRYNTTIYSYPFWFINSLLVVNICYCLIKKYTSHNVLINIKIGGGKCSVYYSDIICIVCYVLIHTPLFNLLPIPLPWGVDAAIGAFVFFHVGNRLKNLRLNGMLLVGIAILSVLSFTFLNSHFNLDYRINMKSMTYNHVLLDLMVPLSFIFVFLWVSNILKRIPYISTFIAYVGKSSMTIYFTHAALLYSMKTYFCLYNVTAIIITISVGLTLHYLFGLHKTSKLLLLGTD